MKKNFYKQWKNKRVKKIINIFGKSWFAKKKILELGACHGDIGIEFLNLGADVIFCDARLESLKDISNKVHMPVKICELDQNYDYDLEKKFDLILHLGTLYHVENWRNDLKCALRHGDLMILETMVNPNNNDIEKFCDYGIDNPYDSFNCKTPIFSENMVEEFLGSLGCKFFRFDTSDLNTDWRWSNDNVMIKHEYDWHSKEYENFHGFCEYCENDVKYVKHLRRMWLILK
jgi:hypothetical protein